MSKIWDFRFKNSAFYTIYIGTLLGCRFHGYWYQVYGRVCHGYWYQVYGCVCHAEGCGLLLAKGCDSIAALKPCKQIYPLKISAHINWRAVYA